MTFRYPYGSDVGAYTPYYTGHTQVPATNIGYDGFSTDIADSTTYDPRPGLDPLAENGGLMTSVVTTGKNCRKSVDIFVYFMNMTYKNVDTKFLQSGFIILGIPDRRNIHKKTEIVIQFHRSNLCYEYIKSKKTYMFYYLIGKIKINIKPSTMCQNLILN